MAAKDRTQLKADQATTFLSNGRRTKAENVRAYETDAIDSFLNVVDDLPGLVTISMKDQANGYVGLDSNKKISLTNSIGAYDHTFNNSNAAGYCYFRVSNDAAKEIAIAVFGSTSNPAQLYTANSAWVSAVSPVAGFINEQVGSVIIFAVGGATATSESMRVTSSGIKIFASKGIEFDTTAGGFVGRTALDKIGFYGTTAIVQPTTGVGAATYASVGGNNVQDNDTFDGYSIRQVIKALRNLGILQ